MLAVKIVIVVLYALLLSLIVYVALLTALTIPFLQAQVIYLHRVVLTWFQNADYPMQWGFLPNQVTPFKLRTSDNEILHAWHILPIGLYQQHEDALSLEPAGPVSNVTDRLSFKLLRDDPQSLLVLYLHGGAGTLGSGWRPPSYRAMHALGPNRIHTLAVDYRGFGTSTGQPSEEGLLTDAKTLLHWATHEAKISPERIVLFGQSLGTALAVSLAHHLAERVPEPVFLKGMVLVAPFANVEELTSTYSIAGTFPLLAPLARFPTLHAFFKTFLICKWPSKDKLASLVRIVEGTESARYDVTIIHAKDDWDIPWSHSEILFWHAVEATVQKGESFEEIRDQIGNDRRSLGAGGWSIRRETTHGVMRQQIVENGLHDRIMSYPCVSLAIWRAFQAIGAETR